MGIVDLIFVLVAAPVFFFILVWAVVTAYRLLAPEPPPRVPDPATMQQQATARGKHVPVGVREIREDQRHSRVAHACAPYQYAYGESEGLPAVWVEDLWRRRN